MQEKTPHAAWQWNPPPRARQLAVPFDGPAPVESATECTGLVMRVPRDEGAAQAVSELYAIHRQQVAWEKH